MLRAHLEGKLGRVIHRALDEPSTGGRGWRSLVRADEDTLTSAVVARLTYLELATLNRLLAHAQHIGGLVAPLALPRHPEARFWPSLAPGATTSDRTFVEPDVILDAGDRVVLIEAKWLEPQSAGQWRVQLDAAARRYPRVKLALVALGGFRQSPEVLATIAREVEPLALNDGATLYALSWDTVFDWVHAELRLDAIRPAEACVLRDVRLALEDRGLRMAAWFASLTKVAERHASGCSELGWHPLRPRRVGFAPLATTPMAWGGADLLYSWRLR